MLLEACKVRVDEAQETLTAFPDASLTIFFSQARDRLICRMLTGHVQGVIRAVLTAMTSKMG